MPSFVIIVLIILIAVAAVYGFYAAGQRRKALTAWARTKGLLFDRSHYNSLDDNYRDFGCLHLGHSRFAYNVIRGQMQGRKVCGFDYHYVTGSGKNRSTHRFSAVIVSSLIPLQPLRIRPEGFFDKVAEFFGADDIDFESAEFSRKFYVSSPNKRWAYDVIHQQMMEYLLAGPALSVQFGGGDIIAWAHRLFKPNEFETAMKLIFGMLDRLPDYLIRQQKDLAEQD